MGGYGGTDSQSSQSINPFTQSGNGQAQFYFGGNPSAAMIFGQAAGALGSPNMLVLGLAALAVFFLVKR